MLACAVSYEPSRRRGFFFAVICVIKPVAYAMCQARVLAAMQFSRGSLTTTSCTEPLLLAVVGGFEALLPRWSFFSHSRRPSSKALQPAKILPDSAADSVLQRATSLEQLRLWKLKAAQLPTYECDYASSQRSSLTHVLLCCWLPFWNPRFLASTYGGVWSLALA